jgi:hypothetical protein
LKKIWKLLKSHVAIDFNWKLYSLVAAFLAIAIIINYRIDLENDIIDKHAGEPVRILYYLLLQSSVYFAISFIVLYSRNQLHHFRSLRYWAITVAGLFCLCAGMGFPYLQKITLMFGGSFQVFKWTYGVMNNVTDFFIQTLPLFVFARFFDRRRENFGVNRKNIDFGPYWQILLIVLPLVIIASFEDGFRNYYPMYRRYEITAATNPTDIPSWLFALGYEFVYGMDFFNVEFLFRGVLVIGVSQVIGKEAILPMVGAYCVLHFGKPVGECVSSIFGGYILGVVALYTRNIWGGVIVHIGLAWMMETVAFVQRTFQ